jgi:hypothetical protein
VQRHSNAADHRTENLAGSVLTRSDTTFPIQANSPHFDPQCNGEFNLSLRAETAGCSRRRRKAKCKISTTGGRNLL